MIVTENLFEISKYEKNNAKITDGVKKVLKSDKLEIKKNSKESSDEVFTYDLKINDKLISKVSLKSTDTYTRMAILTINEWEVVESENYFTEGIYNYEITIPSNYKLYINDIEADNGDILKEGDVEGLERLTKHIEIQKSKTYKINNLVYEPSINIVDENNKKIDYEIKDNKIVVDYDFKEIEKLEDAKKYIKDDFNILELAENWSLFLTDDLSGSYHGFHRLTPYLLENTYMYEMAYGWSHNVDITFVSSHSLKNKAFSLYPYQTMYLISSFYSRIA